MLNRLSIRDFAFHGTEYPPLSIDNLIGSNLSYRFYQ